MSRFVDKERIEWNCVYVQKCKTSFQNKLMAGSLVKIYAVENAYGVI